MSQHLELPDPLFDALQLAASASGTTPVGWIAAHLPSKAEGLLQDGAKSLAELLADRIGSVHSGGTEALSINGRKLFTDHLEQKRHEGGL